MISNVKFIESFEFHMVKKMCSVVIPERYVKYSVAMFYLFSIVMEYCPESCIEKSKTYALTAREIPC